MDAADPISAEERRAARVIKKRIARGLKVSGDDIVLLSRVTNEPTPTSAEPGSATTGSASVPMSPISWNSGRLSSASNRQWPTPTTAHEVAAQANQIATMILNGEIDLEMAKAYSATLRTAAQMLGLDVQRSRYLQIEPHLRLDDDYPAR